MQTKIFGVDFTSAPSKRKSITLAQGQLRGAVVQLEGIELFDSFAAFEALLAQDQAWIGGFDLPFGLPRELVQTLNWPLEWPALIAHYASLEREQIAAHFKAFCDARPVGSKFAHRAGDHAAGASSSMKWVNPPVAFMLHAGVPRLLAAGVSFPGLAPKASSKIALEAYPGLLARELIGSRSYKNDARAKQTPERLIARRDIVTAIEAGRTKLKLRLKLSPAQAQALEADASGDSLDAALCLMQAAWAATQGAPRYGLPKTLDPLEGAIITSRLYA